MNRYVPGSQFAPPSVPPDQTRPKPECAKCGREIVFIEMDATGKLMPCDPVQVYGDGRRSLVVRFERGKQIVGRVIVKATEDVFGFEPHWGTCPCRPRKVVVPEDEA